MEFAEDHREQIEDAEAGWDLIEQEAAALGYDGTQVGPLGR